MRLSLQTFSSLVQNMAASVQSSATQLLDLTVGSALRAILEANASTGLWMQLLIVQVLQSTRASTSAGADLDSWTADFSFSRLPATPASGTVTFSRYTPTASASVPVGALVRTSDGTQIFATVADPAALSFIASSASYLLPAGVASIDVPVQAQTAGTQGDVLAGAITLLATAIQGVDTVVNAAPLTNGLDAETDAAVRTRFQSFIDTRSRATPAAVGFAVASVEQGLSYTLQENVDPSGAARPGMFVVTVDDGSGHPSQTLLSSVQAAVEAVRPVGSTFAVQPPTVVEANVSLTLSTGAGAASPELGGSVAAALTAYIDGLPLGAPLAASRLAYVAYAASSAVTNVFAVLINGSAGDVAGAPATVIKAGTVAVS
jgi:uncharacterized phage protein gp47/JayE